MCCIINSPIRFRYDTDTTLHEGYAGLLAGYAPVSSAYVFCRIQHTVRILNKYAQDTRTRHTHNHRGAHHLYLLARVLQDIQIRPQDTLTRAHTDIRSSSPTPFGSDSAGILDVEDESLEFETDEGLAARDAEHARMNPDAVPMKPVARTTIVGSVRARELGSYHCGHGYGT